MTDYFHLAERGDKVPANADYMLTVTDELMLPYIRRGEAVYISSQDTLEEFDIGVFLWQDKIICRQWCEDYGGNLILLCSNPSYKNETLVIGKAERAKCLCLGKVLTREKPTHPEYM